MKNDEVKSSEIARFYVVNRKKRNFETVNFVGKLLSWYCIIYLIADSYGY